MDYSNIKLPKVNIGSIFIAIALGVFVAMIVYQGQIRGLIPSYSFQIPKLTQNEQIKTIVQEENAVISVVEKVSPFVVAIGVTKRVFNPFDPFSIPAKKDSTIGTGFVVSDKGIIVTNKHVVSETGTKYSVVTKDGQKYDIEKIYRDSLFDLAIVQIEANGLKALELGDSSKLKVGQTAIAIGNALGEFTNTVTTGVISGLSRKVTAGDPYFGSSERFENLIQTDAAINPGNSGGPLLNSAGQVVGVNVATTEGAQNIGFAIPINSVKEIVNEFVNKGSVTRPFLGVSYKFISREVASMNSVPGGAYIQDLLRGGPAEKAGVEIGDIIVKINGEMIDSENKIAEIVSKSSIGTSVDLVVWRNGKEVKLTAILSELPSE